MVATVDWDSIHVAGAFIVGAVFATVATIRVMRAVVMLLSRRERVGTDGDDDTPVA